MNINSISQTYIYQQKLEEVKKTDGVTAQEQTAVVAEEAVKVKADKDMYISSKKTEDSSDSSVTNRDNKALVEQLKAEQAQLKDRFMQTVKNTISQQAQASFGEDDVWKLIAKGNFTVDDETKEAAKQAISEEGYWGVEQTAQRIVDFAKALANNDPEKAETVKDAFTKGYKQAEEAWGGALPEICGKTYDKVVSMFDEWE